MHSAWCSRTCACIELGRVALQPHPNSLHCMALGGWVVQSNPLHLFLAHGHSNATLGHDLDHHHGVRLLSAGLYVHASDPHTYVRHAQCVKQSIAIDHAVTRRVAARMPLPTSSLTIITVAALADFPAGAPRYWPMFGGNRVVTLLDGECCTHTHGRNNPLTHPPVHVLTRSTTHAHMCARNTNLNPCTHPTYARTYTIHPLAHAHTHACMMF